ncbi:hypothetical protein [Alteromonas sp. 1_MG-2023]|uniref:hypothetical protein n=1 Tax=Alteromonas sp. 1_MG-2023 TaxID=3062669 RepID=UPI0034A572C8
MFSALRQCPDLQVFYEPYHPEILKYVEACQKGIPNADRERLGHTVEGDYFEEYRYVDTKEMGEVYNLKSRTLDHPLLEATSEKSDLYNYVAFLFEHANGNGKTPVLQANRLNFCFNWFNSNFPGSYNILVTRNSRDIFLSLQKLAKKDGINLDADTIGLDYWNVLSIFNSLQARYPKIKELKQCYYYKLCFVVEWINRVESKKADLILPYESLGNPSTQNALAQALKVFSKEALPVCKYIEGRYIEASPLAKSEDLNKIERLVEEQLSSLDYIY